MHIGIIVAVVVIVIAAAAGYMYLSSYSTTSGTTTSAPVPVDTGAGAAAIDQEITVDEKASSAASTGAESAVGGIGAELGAADNLELPDVG